MNYAKLADDQIVQKTEQALSGKGYHVAIAKNKAEALDTIKNIIPKGSSVMNGASVTLEQIGYQDYLKQNEHGWNDLHGAIYAENDEQKRAELRKKAVLSDFYLGSVHALIENGDMIIASNTGSQLPHIVYTSPNLIFVISTKKIVPNEEEGMKRLKEHVVPMEDKHMQDLYQMNTALNKILIFKGEPAHSQREIHIILVEEDVGF